MNEFNPVPPSISHKELNYLLTKASKDISGETLKNNVDQEKFNALVKNWEDLSKKILLNLEKKNDFLIAGKGPKSLMALGALEVHLNMAVQAFQASEKDSE